MAVHRSDDTPTGNQRGVVAEPPDPIWEGATAQVAPRRSGVPERAVSEDTGQVSCSVLRDYGLPDRQWDIPRFAGYRRADARLELEGWAVLGSTVERS